MKKQNLILSSLILFFFFINTFSTIGQELKIISGKAFVSDGDTIKINNERIRFSGIDAPESNFYGKKQLCYLDDVEVLCGNLSTKKLKKK
jgi:endonuclease YncB( thermonuclease family)